MLQRFRVDRPAWLLYLAGTCLGCGHTAPVLVPETARPVSADSVSSWVSATAPRGPVLYRFTWLYQDEQASKGGRGSARIALPDTMRFDIAGSLGIGKGSALVVGDRAAWTEPERTVEDLVPDIELLWALAGIARPPADGATLLGLAEPHRHSWRYVEGADTVDYQRSSTSPTRLHAELRRGGKLIGRSVVTLKGDGMPLEARLTVPSVPAKLEIKYYATATVEPFGPDTWAPPAP